MQSAARIVLSLFLVASVASAYHSSAKLRRDGVLNLYPFPRVGRSNPHTWEVPVNDMYLESAPISKRQLYPFPRVGRNQKFPDLELTPLNLEELLLIARARGRGLTKRESESDPDGMWFGPRLGRGPRSEDDVLHLDSNESSEEQVDPEHSYSVERHTKNSQ